MVLSRWVSSLPLNMATNAQKWFAFSPLTEKGTMWQQAGEFVLVMMQVPLSREAQATLTASLREALDPTDPEDPVALELEVGPGVARKALRPLMITSTSS